MGGGVRPNVGALSSLKRSKFRGVVYGEVGAWIERDAWGTRGNSEFGKSNSPETVVGSRLSNSND